MTHGGSTDLKFEGNWMQAEEVAAGAEADFDLLNGNSHHVVPDNERYQGYGPGEWCRTKRMLSRLAVRMSYGDQGADGRRLGSQGRHLPNPEIPAGYTYFAQLVGHDIVATGEPFPTGRVDLDEVRSYRQVPLALECVYGAGPDLTPLPYESRESSESVRRRLRLGATRHTGSDVPNSKERDIPRVACPYISGRSVSSSGGRLGPTDDLLADSRNGDNLILSQLTALFHYLHNVVLEKVDQAPVADPQPPEPIRERQNFEAAQRLVVRVYRRIIRQDLLKKLLDCRVYEHYAQTSEYSGFAHKFHSALHPEQEGRQPSSRVPLEFSHAAYRFGHAMISDRYSLNAAREGAGRATTTAIVKFTSSRKPSEMPLACDWLIDGWSRFFEGTTGNESTNPSRLITPNIAVGLIGGSDFAADDGNPGQLIYRDLVRGAAVGVRTVASLLDEFGIAEVNDYPLGNPCSRARLIREWLRQDKGGDLSEDEICKIADDPPLFFFVLFEAMVGRGPAEAGATESHRAGECLGLLGSKIVAEVIFYSLWRTRKLDEVTVRDAELEQQVFGDARPKTMSELVDWLNVGEDWGRCASVSNHSQIIDFRGKRETKNAT